MLVLSFDIENKKGKAKIQTGPMTKNEAMLKVFGTDDKYASFGKDSGIFIQIDAYQDDKEILEKGNTKEIVLDSIDNLQQIFEGFLIHFFKKDKKEE